MTTIEIGAGQREIGPIPLGVGMMGWGQYGNSVRGARTPLYVRAFILRNDRTTVALVCCELAFISLAVRAAVCERLAHDHSRLGLREGNLLLTATHTHSGPGGFTHYPFYNVTIPGFVPQLVDQIARTIVEALVQAHDRLRAGVVRWAEGDFAADVEVVFNRSLEAYNLNPDVDPETDRHLAVDRGMRMLRFDGLDGRPIGAINWFAVHCTSVHSDNRLVHFDNKGYAAQLFESDLRARGHADFVGAFAQGAAGDVTPNAWRHPGKNWTAGRRIDDDESALDNGSMQCDQALKLFEAAGVAEPLPVELDSVHTFVDMSNVEVDDQYAAGASGQTTGPAEIGLAMIFGTAEGPGLPRWMMPIVRLAAQIAGHRMQDRGTQVARRRIQAEKVTVIETGRRRLLGISRLRRLPVPWRIHPTLPMVRQLDQAPRIAGKPWTPHVLPLQLVRIGPVAIAGVPAQFTTTAGRRLLGSVASALSALAIDHVVLAGYANGYSGYVATAEEYTRQDYEGASTHFGKWTLAAYQTVFDRVARRLLTPPAARPPAPRLRPPVFTDDDLAGRLWQSNDTTD